MQKGYVPPMPKQDPDNGFWTQSARFEHVRDFARSRGTHPLATLGTVLRRTMLHVPPNVVLPPTLGGVASVNLFTAPVGKSGAGKDLANSAGRDAIVFEKKLIGQWTPVNDDDFHVHPGSGEGLARIFHGDKNGKGGTDTAHLQVPDIATLEALADRKGQTLVSQLLHAYMGQPIGFTNAQKDTTTAVKAHEYRLCLSVGVQPENAGFFLSREKDGFPQRFLWLPTLDPYALKDRPNPIAPLHVQLPDFNFDPNDLNADGHYVIDVPDDIQDEVWHAHYLVNIDANGIDPLDSHLKLTQLKASVAIAVFHGRLALTHIDWKLGEQLIDRSNAVRAGLRAAVDAKARREDSAKAHRQADREAIVRERLSEDSQQRVVKAIKNKLNRVKQATEYDLRTACTSAIRDDFPTVFAFLCDKGFLVSCGGGGGNAAEYTLGPNFP